MRAAAAAPAFLRHVSVLAGRDVRRALTRRGLLGIVVGPVVFLLAFTAAFRSLLDARGVDYHQYLPPGIVVQAMLETAIATAFFVSGERRSGLLERWRSLPIESAVVPAARLVADAVRAAIAVVAVVAVAYVIGFRFEAGAARGVAFVLLAVAFAICLAAGTAALGLAATNPELVLSLLFLPFLPLVAISTVFVPADAFAGWLRPVVEASPISVVADSLRALATGGPLSHSLWRALAWMAAFATCFGYLAARAFRRAG